MIEKTEKNHPEESTHESVSQGGLRRTLFLWFLLFSFVPLTAFSMLSRLHGHEKFMAAAGIGVIILLLSFFIARRIGIAITSSHPIEKMTDLLAQTRKQAIQLERQQVELKASEEKFRAKQTELKKTNEQLEKSASEMEEQTSVLELQKIEIEKKNEELETAQKSLEKRADDLGMANEYKSQFLANMSHELRTPLNSILILSRILTDNPEGNLTEKQAEYAGTILSSGTDVLSLINDVLDLSKVEIGRMDVNVQDVILEDLVMNMERTFQPVAQKNRVSLESRPDKGLPSHIRTDQQRLEQILKNLFSNAFKFTFKGGVLFQIGRPGKQVDLSKSGLIREETLAFSVSDTGIGISKDKQKIVFDAFQQADGTTSRKYGGTGLGLSISREFAKLLGGEIQLESETKNGSTFTLYLPDDYESKAGDTSSPLSSIASGADILPELADTPLKNQQPEALNVRALPENKGVEGLDTQFVHDDRKWISPDDKSLLIIEDDRFFAQIFRDLAREEGFKTLVAESGEIGLHFVDLYKPSAIILDMVLPGIDGWSVMTRLKEDLDTRHIPVQFMSGFDNQLDAMKMGAIGFLEKPAKMESVRHAIERLEQVISKSVKDLLVIAEDPKEQENISEIIGDGDVSTTAVASARDALNHLRSKNFDCVILDLNLSDMPGLELLDVIKSDEALKDIPVIVCTDKGIARDEEKILKQYADKIIIKGVRFSERLLDGTTLFLHRVEANLSDGKRKMLQQVHDKEQILKDKKILMVDDDMRNVFAVSAILEKIVGQVHVGKNGVEALEKLEQHPDMDLVLMDIMMPKMDGYEAMSEIRSQDRFKKLPIIALTAKAMKGDREKCIEAGADDYLAKPVDSEKLLSMMRVWLY